MACQHLKVPWLLNMILAAGDLKSCNAVDWTCELPFSILHWCESKYCTNTWVTTWQLAKTLWSSKFRRSRTFIHAGRYQCPNLVLPRFYNPIARIFELSNRPKYRGASRSLFCERNDWGKTMPRKSIKAESKSSAKLWKWTKGNSAQREQCKNGIVQMKKLAKLNAQPPNMSRSWHTGLLP